MTGPEREDFRELRGEMRDGFRDLTTLIRELNVRVASLELTRASAIGADEVRSTARAYGIAERRWRIGVALSIAVSIAIGLANLVIPMLTDGK